MRRMCALAVAALVGAFVAVGIAQQTLVVDVNLKLLTVRVRNPQGKPVRDLTPEDFEIIEDGQHRPVSHLSIQRRPAAIGLLVDRSISLQAARKSVIQSVVRICNGIMPDDQLFLMTFSTATKTDVSWTSDAGTIVSAIHRLRPAAGTRFYDALVDALDELSISRLPLKRLIVVTDGADHYSTHTLQQVIGVANLYGSEIDIIPYKGNDSRIWTPGGREQVFTDLEKLATATGGQLLSSSDIEGTVVALHDIDQLGFYSSAPADESLHLAIRIRNHPELTVFPELSRGPLEK